jgi:hypothetical protein
MKVHSAYLVNVGIIRENQGFSAAKCYSYMNNLFLAAKTGIFFCENVLENGRLISRYFENLSKPEK